MHLPFMRLNSDYEKSNIYESCKFVYYIFFIKVNDMNRPIDTILYWYTYQYEETHLYIFDACKNSDLSLIKIGLMRTDKNI